MHQCARVVAVEPLSLSLSSSSFLRCRSFTSSSSLHSSSSRSDTTIQSVVPEICKADLEQLLLTDDASHELPFILIDVRNPSELAHGVIPGAHNVPLGDLHSALALDDKAFLAKYKFSKPTMDTRVVVYCRSGARSELATLMLLQLGWTQTRNYRGSFNEWFGRTYDM